MASSRVSQLHRRGRKRFQQLLAHRGIGIVALNDLQNFVGLGGAAQSRAAPAPSSTTRTRAAACRSALSAANRAPARCGSSNSLRNRAPARPARPIRSSCSSPRRRRVFRTNPGRALRTARARSASSFCAASSSGVSAATWGVDVSGLHPVWHGTAFGFFDLRLCCEDCAKASNAPPRDRLTPRINAISERTIEEQNNTEFSGEPEKRTTMRVD